MKEPVAQGRDGGASRQQHMCQRWTSPSQRCRFHLQPAAPSPATPPTAFSSSSATHGLGADVVDKDRGPWWKKQCVKQQHKWKSTEVKAFDFRAVVMEALPRKGRLEAGGHFETPQLCFLLRSECFRCFYRVLLSLPVKFQNAGVCHRRLGEFPDYVASPLIFDWLFLWDWGKNRQQNKILRNSKKQK